MTVGSLQALQHYVVNKKYQPKVWNKIFFKIQVLNNSFYLETCACIFICQNVDLRPGALSLISRFLHETCKLFVYKNHTTRITCNFSFPLF